MADHAIVAVDAPRNDTTHLNTEPDSVRDAFKQYQAGHAALRLVSHPGEETTEAEHDCWDIIDLADKAVGTLPATTIDEIACKPYLAIWHSVCDTEIEQAAIRADFEWFDRRDATLDWPVRLLVSALRDLKSMEVGQC